MTAANPTDNEREALKRGCDYCGADPGCWCWNKGTRASVLGDRYNALKLHAARLSSAGVKPPTASEIARADDDAVRTAAREAIIFGNGMDADDVEVDASCKVARGVAGTWAQVWIRTEGAK